MENGLTRGVRYALISLEYGKRLSGGSEFSEVFERKSGETRISMLIPVQENTLAEIRSRQKQDPTFKIA